MINFMFQQKELWDKPNMFLLPHPSLRQYIAHYTVSFPTRVPHMGTLTLIPDASGCIVCRIYQHRAECNFWGATTQTVNVSKNANLECVMFFVEFLPCGAQQLFHLDFSDYTNIQLPIEMVEGQIQSKILQVIEQAKSLKELAQRMDCLFLEQAARRNCTRWPLELIHFIQKKGKIPSVEEIAADTAYSERHMNRLLLPSLGLSMKQYLRLRRINKAVQSIKSAPVQLTQLAQHLGYYDQAHFNHDFKSVCAVTPTQYRRKMSDFYNEEFKF